MPKSSGTASRSSSAWSRTAIATGKSMSAVAVFEIHMLQRALASIKPKTTLRDPPPVSRTMLRAMRRCAPTVSTALESTKPPIKSKMRWWPYAPATSLCVVTFKSGNAANGIIEVAAIGMGSSIHHAAHKVVIAAVARAGLESSVKTPKAQAIRAAKATPIPILAPVPTAAELATTSLVSAAHGAILSSLAREP